MYVHLIRQHVLTTAVDSSGKLPADPGKGVSPGRTRHGLDAPEDSQQDSVACPLRLRGAD